MSLSPEQWRPHPKAQLPDPRELPDFAARFMASGFPHPQDIAAFRATLPPVLTVTIATPCDDGHRLCYWQSLIAAVQARLPNIILRLDTPRGDSLVPRGRNRQLHNWYYGTADDYLHTIDSDIDFSVDDLVRTYTNPLPVKAGLYAIKQDEHRWCMNAIPTEPLCPVTKFQRVGTAGTGWLGVHRSVAARMIAAANFWPHWKINFIDDQDRTTHHLIYAHAVVDDPKEFTHSPRELSEDWSFCYFARQLGYDVWMDHGVATFHEGAALYPRGARRMTREEEASGMIRQPDGSRTPIQPNPMR